MQIVLRDNLTPESTQHLFIFKRVTHRSFATRLPNLAAHCCSPILSDTENNELFLRRLLLSKTYIYIHKRRIDSPPPPVTAAVTSGSGLPVLHWNLMAWILRQVAFAGGRDVFRIFSSLSEWEVNGFSMRSPFVEICMNISSWVTLCCVVDNAFLLTFYLIKRAFNINLIFVCQH